MEGHAKVVGLNEPENAPTLHAALTAGEPADVAVSGVAADSLGARRSGDIGFSVAVRAGVVSVMVSDADIVTARSLLWNDYRVAVEHGAAAAYAALTSGAYEPRPGPGSASRWFSAERARTRPLSRKGSRDRSKGKA